MYVLKNKKGFTLVELVIVIAVVAILAAVLIPTFSDLVKKANMTADQMAVKNMNTVLSLEDNANNDRVVALEILETGGFNTENLIPTTANHRFYWNSTYNMVLLVDCTNQDNLIVVFPQNIPDVIEDFNNNYYLSYDLSNLLPRATLTPLDNLTVVSNLGEETLDVGIALSTTENEASVEFANWEADFTISFNRDLEFSENFNDDKTLADSNKVALFLGGQYDAFGEDWLAFPATEAEVYSISANEEIRVIGTVLDGSGIPYNFICDSVNTFNCGIKIIPGDDMILSGLVVTLKLKLYEPDNGQEERKSYIISTFRYTYK